MSIFGKKNSNEKPDLEVFAMYDSRTKQYNLPSYYLNEDEARRAAELLFLNPASQDILPVTCSQDFSLFRIGTYDRATGVMTPIQHEHILNMHEVKAYIETKLGPKIQ